MRRPGNYSLLKTDRSKLLEHVKVGKELSLVIRGCKNDLKSAESR